VTDPARGPCDREHRFRAAGAITETLPGAPSAKSMLVLGRPGLLS
jgi:hypothetical protein